MRRAAALLALLATSCTTMEPKYVRPEPAIPASWPVGDPYLVAAEAGLPALTYQQVFQRRAAADAHRPSARQQPQPEGRRGKHRRGARAISHPARATSCRRSTPTAAPPLSGDKDKGVSAQYQAGVSVPNFELDLFGRLRSLTDVQLNRYFATEAGARATRLTLVADVANAWLDHAADSSLLRIAEQTAASAQKSVRLTRLRLEGGIAPRTDLDQAEQILAHGAGGPRAPAHRGRAGRQRASAARRRADRIRAARRLDRRGIRQRSRPSRRARIPTCCCAVPMSSRPSMSSAQPMRTSARRARRSSRRSR